MQRHRMGLISNFFDEPMGQPGVRMIRVVNFEQILFANGRMLDLTEAPAQRGRAFNSTF
jgi:hypothetical protein